MAQSFGPLHGRYMARRLPRGGHVMAGGGGSPPLGRSRGFGEVGLIGTSIAVKTIYIYM